MRINYALIGSVRVVILFCKFNGLPSNNAQWQAVIFMSKPGSKVYTH